MANEILDALLRENVAVAAATLIVLALRAPVRRLFGARVAYALWLGVPIALLAAVAPPRTVVATGHQTAAGAIQPSGRASRAALNLGTTRHRRILIGDDSLLLAAWFIGGFASIGVLLVRQRRFTRSLGPLRWDDRRRAWLSGATEACPAVIGAIRPKIVLPADFGRRYSSPEQAVVLAHEQAHLMGGDPLLGVAAISLQVINWFNPIVYVAMRFFRIDQELACDAAVIAQFPDARRLYGQAMLKTALAARAVPIGCGWPPSTTDILKKRISTMKLATPSHSRRALGLSLVAALVLGGGAAAWAARAPKQVFAAPPHFAQDPSGNVLGDALIEAAAQGDVTGAKKLMSAGADVNHRFEGDGTPLIVAARAGEILMVQLLLDGGANVDLGSPGDGNPLIAASAEGHLDIVKLLAGRGANVNAYVPGDETPLINAVYGGSREVVDFLVRSGADVNLAVWADTGKPELRSPLNMANRAGRRDIVRYLKAHGAR